MLAVEIILIIVGIACVCVSFFVSGGKKGKDEEDEQTVRAADLWTEKDEEVIIKHIDSILEERGMELVETTEDQMNRICNEKIMAIDEFSKPLLDKIHVNHEEVVFMYNMLGEKQKELQRTMEEDTLRKAVPPISSPQNDTPAETKTEQTGKAAAADVKDQGAGLQGINEPQINEAAVQIDTGKPLFEESYTADGRELYGGIPVVREDDTSGVSSMPAKPTGITGLERAKLGTMTPQEKPAEKREAYPEVSTGQPIYPDTVIGESPGNEIGPHRTVFTAHQYEAQSSPVQTVQPIQSVPVQQVTRPVQSVQHVTQPIQHIAQPMQLQQVQPVQSVQQEISPTEQMKRPSREFVMQHMEETAVNGRGDTVEDKVRILYKQGRSVVEISKALGIGQGEVKLMIAMYNKRR